MRNFVNVIFECSNNYKYSFPLPLSNLFFILEDRDAREYIQFLIEILSRHNYTQDLFLCLNNVRYVYSLEIRILILVNITVIIIKKIVTIKQ